MDNIHESFDYGYDVETPEPAPPGKRPRPVTLPSSAYVNLELLPPVGEQYTPSCFVWSSTYGLATFAAAQAGGYSPSSPAQQASPVYTYIQVLLGESKMSNTCVGGAITACFAFLDKNGGTPTMEAAPNVEGCTPSWTAYGGGGLAADPRFQVTGWEAITVTGPDGLDNLRGMIAQGVPLAYGTRLYTDFPDYHGTPSPYVGNGVLLYNKRTGKPAGHCMVIIGYDDSIGAVLIQNSFGTGWGGTVNGSGGYVWMAYDTFEKTAQGTALYITSIGSGNSRR